MKKDPVKTAQEILKAFWRKRKCNQCDTLCNQASRGSKGCIYY